MIIVYITTTGTKYHRATCSYLSSSKIPISLSEAKAEGYTSCSVCNSPKSADADEFQDEYVEILSQEYDQEFMTP